MPKLRQYSRNKACYFCGCDPPSSDEHVPSDAMFVGFDCDRITVPSCDEHNGNKPDQDQAIIVALLVALLQMERQNILKNPFTDNVRTCIDRLAPSLPLVKKHVSLQHRFYDNMIWYAGFSASTRTRRSLGSFVAKIHFA
jgi:hypothetical protein